MYTHVLLIVFSCERSSVSHFGGWINDLWTLSPTVNTRSGSPRRFSAILKEGAVLGEIEVNKWFHVYAWNNRGEFGEFWWRIWVLFGHFLEVCFGDLVDNIGRAGPVLEHVTGRKGPISLLIQRTILVMSTCDHDEPRRFSLWATWSWLPVYFWYCLSCWFCDDVLNYWCLLDSTNTNLQCTVVWKYQFYGSINPVRSGSDALFTAPVQAPHPVP